MQDTIINASAQERLQVKAPVFNVQTYSIHDGPGIRVTVFVKGCPLRCKWCANPESNLTRPQLMTYSSKCTGCGRCIPTCPKEAIRLGEKDGKIVALTDRTRCVDCGTCTDACPVEARDLVGREMTVQEVLEKVLRDKMFMDASGGGMTVSGGECLAHPDFTEALLIEAKARGVHTAVESCCFAKRETVEQVFRHVDLGLLDIKHMDSATHRELTGVDNTQILDNIRFVYHQLHVPIAIRVPTIPGYTDSEENIAAIAAFTRQELGAEVPVHLLPYHRLGESKNASLGKEMDMSIEVPSDEHMQHLKALVESYGLTAQVGG